MKPSLLTEARERIAALPPRRPNLHASFDQSLIRILQPGETLANLRTVAVTSAKVRPQLVVPTDPLTALVEAVHAELASPAA